MNLNAQSLFRFKLILIGIVVLAIAIMLLLIDPIPQWPEYHLFADTRTFFGIANASNVLSNAGFVVVGLWGLWLILVKPWKRASELQIVYLTFFIGIFLTAFGSAWYHLDPGNERLVWDRLPMSVTAMAFLTIALIEFLRLKSVHQLLWPSLLLGMGSVLWWAWTESLGSGDLRPYALVQFLPAVLVLVMMMVIRSPGDFIVAVIGMIVLYGLAKICEHFDASVYQALGGISGHALKHVVAALAAAFMLFPLMKPGPNDIP